MLVDLLVLIIIGLAGSIYLLLCELDRKRKSDWNYISPWFGKKAKNAHVHPFDSFGPFRSYRRPPVLEQLPKAYQRPRSRRDALHSNGEPHPMDSPEVRRALWSIVEYILRDFVDYWFVAVSDNRDFQNDIRHIFDVAFNCLASRAVQVNWTDFIVNHVVESLAHMLRVCRTTEQRLMETDPSFQDLSSDEQVLSFPVSTRYPEFHCIVIMESDIVLCIRKSFFIPL